MGSQPDEEEHTSEPIPLADVDSSIKTKKKSNKTLDPDISLPITTMEGAIEPTKKKKRKIKEGEAAASNITSILDEDGPPRRPKKREKKKEGMVSRKAKIISADPSLPDPSEDAVSNLSDQARKGAYKFEKILQFRLTCHY